ncbi:DUF411 domain-containing protein [Natronosalvus vescus]|uniref:DUF411 domain-containing protein n=1 Tax=Natronosalvus vescus TaxID=2953881 RepID=UPI0020909E26|nr:DUF411 domain-containing protein [Natronosalvus vescus]
MTDFSRRAFLSAGVGTFAITVAGCLGDNTDAWEREEPLAASSATLYQDPNCSCCGVYADYLDDHLATSLETVVTDDLSSVKDEHEIPSDLYSCHTIELDGYLVEGHMPVETIATMLEDEPDIRGISLPGMPQGSPGMGGDKDGTWTVYAINAAGEEPSVYAEL